MIFPMNNFFTNLETHGNCIGTSIPMALYDAIQSKTVDQRQNLPDLRYFCRVLRRGGLVSILITMMFNFRLLFRLLPQTFSFQKDSLRYPSLKRISSVLIFFPLFTLMGIINGAFLLLDEILFPGYRKIPVKKAGFIVGVPRSATTFLLKILAQDEEHFTSFRLWEILLAPSITQKYLFVGAYHIDLQIGRPLYRISRQLDRVLFRRMNGIHPLSFSLPEEDEVLLLHAFSSAYLNYFFPETTELDAYLFFDKEVPRKLQDRIMGFYYRCVQRHNFVFNRKEEKIFLSKNPAFVPKLKALARHFPEAKILYMLRSPFQTIPATISLNAHIYAAFSRLPVTYPLIERTGEFVIQWYEMAEEALKECYPQSHRVVLFSEITRNTLREVHQVYDFLGKELAEHRIPFLVAEEEKSKGYKTRHQYDSAVGIDAQEIQRRLHFLPKAMMEDEFCKS